MAIDHVFAGIAVADYDAALAWYTRYFGRPPDVIVAEHESMWREVGSGWVYVVRDTSRAGKGLLTLLVDDLATHVAEIGERGIEASAIETVPGKYRKAVIADPEGNMVSIGQCLSTDA